VKLANSRFTPTTRKEVTIGRANRCNLSALWQGATRILPQTQPIGHLKSTLHRSNQLVQMSAACLSTLKGKKRLLEEDVEMTPEYEPAVRKISAMAHFTVERGCTTSEADTADRLIEHLVTKYGIQWDPVSRCIKGEEPIDADDTWKREPRRASSPPAYDRYHRTPRQPNGTQVWSSWSMRKDVPISQMRDDHLRNAYNLCKRRLLESRFVDEWDYYSEKAPLLREELLKRGVKC